MTFLDDEFFDLIVRDIGVVLGTDDDRVDTNRRVAFVLDRDLALVVGTQPIDFFVEASLGDAIDDAMRKCDRQRHQFGRVFAGVAEHQSLVARTDVFARCVIGIDALSDIGALRVERDHDGTGVAADSHLVVGVANFVDDFANDVGVIDFGLGRDFAGDDRDSGGDHGFASDAAIGILRRAKRPGCHRKFGRPACRGGPC